MSLRLRLTLLNTLILLLVGGALVAAVYAILVQGLQRQIDDSLREQARLYSDDVSAWFYRESRRLPGPALPRRRARAAAQARARARGRHRTAGQPVRARQTCCRHRRPLAPADKGSRAGPPPLAGRSPGPGGILGPPPGGSVTTGPGRTGAAGTGCPDLPTLTAPARLSRWRTPADRSKRAPDLGADASLPPEGLAAALDGQEWLGGVSIEGQPLRLLVTPLRFGRHRPAGRRYRWCSRWRSRWSA